MKGPKGNGCSRAKAFALLLLLAVTVPLAVASNGPEGAVRADSMVHFDIFSTRVTSDGVSGWENFIVGAVNRTTTVETRLINDIDVPLSGVEVTCTSYWYEGNYPDRGHIMFREMVMVDLPGGKYSASPMVRFKWTPSVSGSYIMNLSAHVPGDARAMSTDPIFLQGKKYEVEGEGYFYSGVWIAKEYWDCSSMEGWDSSTEGGLEEEGWRPVIHPLGSAPDMQHSAPYTYWAGNLTTGLAPKNGTYSLVSPELDLEGFSPAPYDIETKTRKPQIFFIYRYRGNLSSASGLRGRLDHYISVDGGGTWEPLMDSKRNHVNVTDIGPEGHWSISSRPAAYGTGLLAGIDIGGFIGKKVRLRIELIPSGLDQTGVLIDDIVLMGVDRLEERPFSLSGPNEAELEVEPSGKVAFTFNVSTMKWRSDLMIRIGAVNASRYLSLERDVQVGPEVMVVPAGTVSEQVVKVNATVPKGAISGKGSITVRAAGGGHSQDIELTFLVKAVHRLITDLEGITSGDIEPGRPVPVSVRTENTGNIQERVEITFVTSSDLGWERPRRMVVLQPGKGFDLSGNISLPPGSLSGPKVGHFVISPSTLPSDQEVLHRVGSGTAEADWTVLTVTYSSKQFHDLRLISPGTSQYIDDPPDEGVVNLTYNVFLMNGGNGNDMVTFECSELDSYEGIVIALPENITMMANDTEVLDVHVKVGFPIPEGIYNFTVRACSSGVEDTSNNEVELLLVIGRPPVSRGIFLLNGSLQVRPEHVVKGQEAIFFFKARSFGYLQPVQFTVNLLFDGIQVETGVFTSSLLGAKEYQFVVRFQEEGAKEISLVMSGSMTVPEPGGELSRSLNMTVEVRFIEIAIEMLGVNGRTGSDLNLTIAPGEGIVHTVVRNLGNIEVELVTMHLIVQETSEPENRTVVVLNVSELGAGSEVRLEHKYRTFKASTTYHVTLSFQDRGLWKETNNTNDLQTIVIRVGEEEPKEPVWKRPLFMLVTGAVVLFGLLGMSYYLIKKNL